MTATTMTARARPRSSWALSADPLVRFAVVALLVGAFLRLVWPEDIHYLGDEDWTFRHVQASLRDGSWDALGMTSSRGLKNPGLSVWVFVMLGKVAGASTPAELTRGVALLGVAANALLLVVPLRLVDCERDRRAWLWAIILASTNPILVFLERKIWAQSVLPIFMVVTIIAWMQRRSRSWAFVWGVTGALLGQIHMAGFFFTAALALWTRLFAAQREPSWPAWSVGTVAGLVPAVPWIGYLVTEHPGASSVAWWQRFRFAFYQYFLSDPFGLSGEYVVGKDIARAMRWPIVFGQTTWLVLVAHGILAVVAGALAYRAIRLAWQLRHSFRTVLGGGTSDTSLLLAAVLVGMGVLMTLPSISMHRHYMLATFPLEYLLVARVALSTKRGERLLAALFVGCTVVSLGILTFVRDVGENAEMGKTYATQLRLGITAEQAKPEGHP